MKKVIITVTVLLFATTGFAQFSFGAKGAVNFSKFSTNLDELKTNRNPGFDLGFFARVGISKLYVQPELVYSFTSTDFDTVVDDMKNIKSSSIDVPVLVGYKLLDFKAFNLRAFLGPRFSFVVHDNFKDSFKSAAFNFAGQAGLGFDLFMFTVDFRYDYTFTKTASATETASVNNGNLRFNTFLISLGWKIL
jgi:hypothetical protein